MNQSTSDDDVLRAVGGALSNWSMVELQLSTLFSNISDMGQNRARTLFDGIISFDVRVGICDRLMALEDVDEVEAEMWNRMSARLGKFYKKRHELAHFSLVSTGPRPTIMPFMTFEKIFAENSKKLTATEIKERSGKFLELHMAASWFANRAFHRRASKPEAPMPAPVEPPLVPRLRASAIQILEERKQQPPAETA